MKAQLSVPRSELAQALKPFTKLTKSKHLGDVVLLFKEGELRFYYTGLDTAASAEGTWDGQVRVKCEILCRIAGFPPPKDPVVVQVDGDQLKINGFSVPCVWETTAQRDLFGGDSGVPIQLPMDPPLALLVSVALDFTKEEISKSGITDQIQEAHKRKAILISQAAHALTDLEITRSDVEKLVNDRLTGKSKYSL